MTDHVPSAVQKSGISDKADKEELQKVVDYLAERFQSSDVSSQIHHQQRVKEQEKSNDKSR